MTTPSQKAIQAAYSRAWRARHPEFKHRANELRRKRRAANPEKYRAFDKAKYAKDPELYRARMKRARLERPKRAMLNLTRNRAKAKGLEFSITEADIDIPTHCPILGIEFRNGERHHTASSPTIDRIDNTRGYVPGNVRVISWRANKLKSDATVEELRLIVERGFSRSN